jgi:hypothetical protein
MMKFKGLKCVMSDKVKPTVRVNKDGTKFVLYIPDKSE